MKHVYLFFTALLFANTATAQFTFDMPGATETYVTGINDGAEIVGYFTDAGGATKAFFYNGTDTVIVQYNGHNTWFEGINNLGKVAGYYNPTGSGNDFHVFTYNTANGQFTLVPGLDGHEFTKVHGINDEGVLSGDFKNSGFRKFFTYSTANGLNSVGYNLSQNPTYGGHKTTSTGYVTGYFINGSIYTGFIWKGVNNWDTIQVPFEGLYKTKVLGGNEFSFYLLEVANKKAYKWYRPDDVTSIMIELKVPEAMEVHPHSINKFGNSCGYYKDSSYVVHGFYERAYDIGFKPNPHGHNFPNDSASIWPQPIWENINYAHDPYLGGNATFRGTHVNQTFPSWSDWVNTFGEGYSYFTSPLGNKYINWRSFFNWVDFSDTSFGGACYGFAVNTLQIYDSIELYQQKYPNAGIGSQNVFQYSATPEITQAIRRSHISQRAKLSWDYMQAGHIKHVNKILDELKTFMADSTAPHVLLNMTIQTGKGGGHAVVPYKIANSMLGGNVIDIYDNNFPGGDEQTIVINQLAANGLGAYSYAPAGEEWGNQSAKGALNYVPVMNFFVQPMTPDQMVPSHPGTVATNTRSNEMFFNTEQATNFTVHDSDNNVALATNDTTQNDIPGSMFRYQYTGQPRKMTSISLAAGTYYVGMQTFDDKPVQATTLTENAIYHMERNDNAVGDKDSVIIGDIFTYVNPSSQNRNIDLQAVAYDNGTQSSYRIDDILVGLNQHVSMQIVNTNQLMLVNNGGATSYNLTLEFFNGSTMTTFQHAAVPIAENTSHLVVPTFGALSDSGVWIIVDNEENGTNDDTLFYQNNATPMLSLSDYELHFPGSGAEATFGIENSGAGILDWTITSVPIWVTILSPMSGSGNASISYSVPSYSGTLRSGYIVVEAPGAPNAPDTIFVSQDASTSAPITTERTNLLLFPNPAEDKIHVQLTCESDRKYRLVVLDVTGREVFKSLQVWSNTTTETFDLKTLPPGVYTVRMTDKSGIHVKKFVKMK